MEEEKNNSLNFLLAAISTLSISGSFVYLVYLLNWPGIIIALTLSILSLGAFVKFGIIKKPIIILPKIAKEEVVIGLFYFLLTGLMLFILFNRRTDEALVSPWQVIPHSFFVLYAIATATIFFSPLKKVFLPLSIIHYFLSFSILWIVFRYGYGYDPLIHQSSLEAIEKLGSINPKQILYLGQYSLEIFAHKIFFLPFNWVDKLLVPALAALTIPPAINCFLGKFNTNKKLPILLLLILPFSIFTLTVPQSLAYLFLLLAILLGISQEKITLPWLLSLAAFCTHPLAGIPALAWAVILTIRKKFPNRAKKIAYSAIIILIPIGLFLSLSLSQKQNTASAKTEITAKSLNLLSGLSKQEDVTMNFINFFHTYQALFLLLLIIGGVAVFFVNKNKDEKTILSLATAVSIFSSWLFVKNFINFSSLIDYEQGDYLARLLVIGTLFTLPFLIMLFSFVTEKALSKNTFIKASWAIFSVLLLTTSLYCSYPRKDNYQNSRSFSVGTADFEAVKWIERDASGKPYVVLANQQVSAAALRTFGFDKYFDTDIGKTYFYPIPTGGPLYKIYLEMVYEKANKKNALKAADLTGVDTIYFVINKYWWAFDKITEEAKIEAASIKEINNDIVIFKYSKNQ